MPLLLTGLGTAAALTLALLAALPYDPEITYGFTRNATVTPAAAPITAAAGLPYTRRTVRFPSQGTACDAWLYTPLHANDVNHGDPIHTPTTTSPDPESSSRNGSHPPPTNTAVPGRPFPVVIMAHGLGGQKDMGLHRFADAFAAAGMAVLVFDYRGFGGSEGEPRQWVSPRRHVDDWRAVLRWVQAGSLGPEYDSNKVALWGTSFAGGHVLVVGAEQPPGSLGTVISMVPHLSGVHASKATLRRNGLLRCLRFLAAGLQDRMRALAARAARALGVLPGDVIAADGVGMELGGRDQDSQLQAGASLEAAEGGGSAPRSQPASPLTRMLTRVLAPVYVKLVGRKDELALMTLDEQGLVSYFAKHPSAYEGGWQPRVLARITWETSSYSPMASVHKLTAPVLFVAATKDELCPAELVRGAAALVPGGRGQLIEVPCTHFDAYHGKMFERAAAAMVEFATEHLLGKRAAGGGVSGEVIGRTGMAE